MALDLTPIDSGGLDLTPLTPNQSGAVLGHSTGLLGNLIGGAANMIGGAVKQVAGTLQNIGMPIASAEQKLLGPNTPQPGIPQQDLQPQGLMQGIGAGIANIGEFIAPAGEVGKAEQGVNALTKAIPGVIGAGARLLGKAGIEAAQGGITSYAQSGNPTDAITGALTFGLAKGATGTVGEAAKAFKIPERLYETIFSKTAEDFKAQWAGKASAEMQKTNPEQYQQLLDAGIIKDQAGKVVVDPSVAATALAKGLKGSGDQMGTLISGQIKQSEQQARELAFNYKGVVKIPQFQPTAEVLRNIAKNFAGVADNRYSAVANGLADKLEQSGGKISGTDALTLRRFMDSMRTESSFDKSLTDIRAVGQRNLKFQSDKIRLALNSSIPGMKDAMKDYAFQIRALDDLSSHMTKAGHAALVSMWDTMIFDVGLSGGIPGLGGAMAIGRRYLGTAGGATRIGQALERGTETKTGAALKGAAADVLSTMSGSTPQQ